MIKFTRNGTRVLASVDVYVPNYETRVLYFEFETNSSMLSGFLSAEIQIQMRDALEKIRREEYERGWKDAKTKNRKEKFFRFGWRG